MPEALTATVTDELLSRPWGAVAIGPGLGVGPKTADAVRKLVAGGQERVVIDADALTSLQGEGLMPLPPTWIATPHSAELGRLLGVDPGAIEADRFRFAAEGASTLGCRVLLKGFRTVVADPPSLGGRAAVVLAGNSGLAKAGTGDVLTGFIAGLLAQGVDPAQAGLLAAYVHGRIADDWIRSGRARAALLASDLLERVPFTLARIRR